MTAKEYYNRYGVSPFPEGKTEKKAPQATRGFAIGLATGAAKSIGETAIGAGELGQKLLQSTAGRAVEGLTGTPREELGQPLFQQGSEENLEARESLEATQPGEGTGKFLGTLAQYLAPTSRITQAQNVLGGAASKIASKAPRIAAQIGARFAPEAAGTGAVAAVRSGGNVDQIKSEALLAGGASVAMRGIGQIARSTYFPQLSESVTKALGIQGKRSGGQALKEVPKKIGALGVLKQHADDTIVTLDDGSRAVFEPKNATFNTTLQAWNNTRKKIYNDYTSLAREAGEDASIDMTPVVRGLQDTLNAKNLSAHKNAATNILDDIDLNFEDITNVSAREAQEFVESLNSQVVNGFYKGTADGASSEANAATSRVIRELLDDSILNRGGPTYQNLRNQYAALKSIEDDLVRRYQQEARKIGGGLSEYVGMFSSGDVVAGLLAGSPGSAARGTVMGSLAALKRSMSDPSRFLRRSFELLDEPEPSQIMQRLFGK